MKPRVEVAVIVPAHNAEKTIARALDAVLAQTASPAEILVVDDGSTDRTSEIVSSYPAPVRLISQKNGGPARARNEGVRASTSEYIAFLDADDAWLPQKIELQVAAMQATPASVLCCTSVLLQNADGSSSSRLAPAPEEIYRLLGVCNPELTPSCVLMSRLAFDRAGGFNEARHGCEDWELWFRLRSLGTFVRVPEIVTIYHVSASGLSSDADRLFQDFLQMLDPVLLADYTGLNRALWRRRILSYQAYKAVLTARAERTPGKELRYAMRSILSWPFPTWCPARFRVFAVTMRRALSAWIRAGTAERER